MYHALLTNRYLTSRVIPLIAVAAVALCVALVIIVVSIMTGFLEMVRNSGRTLMGDVIIAYPVTGIPYYERLIERLEKLPEVAAASPVVDSWGLLKMPYPEGPRKETETVQIWGIEPESFARVTRYAETLYWKPASEAELAEMGPDDWRRVINGEKLDDGRTVAEAVLADGLALHEPGSGRPGIVMGIAVSIGNERQRDGSILPAMKGYWWMPGHLVTLTTLPLDTGAGMVEPESAKLPVLNEFFSGVFLIDDRRVMIPLKLAQGLLRLDEHDLVDPHEFDASGLPKVIGKDPPRATQVLVRAADGFSPDQLREVVAHAYDAFRQEIVDEKADATPPTRGFGLSVKTWLQQQAEFIGPIEKERELMRTLFSLVYLVCAGLVLSIFWAIVYEKTRDIGILRSIGASRLGISWIFLRYGLVIGIAGAIVGLGIAWLVVSNINGIHRAMGDPPIWLAAAAGALAVLSIVMTVLKGRGGALLPITLGSLVTLVLVGIASLIVIVRSQGGIVIWNPEVYYFSVIPNDLDLGSALFTMVGAVVFSLLGAFLPAAKAADTDPVRALRYE